MSESRPNPEAGRGRSSFRSKRNWIAAAVPITLFAVIAVIAGIELLTSEDTTAPAVREHLAERGDIDTVSLVAENRAFSLNQIVASANSQIAVEFENRDDEQHNFSVYRGEGADETAFEGEPVVGSDERVYIVETPAEPGTWVFRCDFHPQEMEGEFVVEDPLR